ncbi:MAG: hypothetical protein GY898_18650 [Proteobacteria bacterium]|nr:hypothetical protein [Pseudomonadota bacterium]
MRRSVLQFLLVVGLPALGCVPDSDDDDSANNDDDSAGDDDDSAGDDEYAGLPPETVPGEGWFEARDGEGAEVYEGLDLEPNSYGGTLPPPAGAAQPLGATGGAMSLNTISGRIDWIEELTWNGDNDTYTFTNPEAGPTHILLEWGANADDLDVLLHCEYGDDQTDFNIYIIPAWPGITDTSVPEAGVTLVPLLAGSRCWLTVVGYSGGPVDYLVTIVPEGGGAPMPGR